jgi:hypothetical protein
LAKEFGEPVNPNVLFRRRFIEVARTLSAADITSDRELGVRFGVAAGTIKKWREAYPEFQAAIDRGATQLIEECTELMLGHARGGSEAAARFLLERRSAAFQAKSQVDIQAHVTTLDETLRRRATAPVTIEELAERGLLIDGDRD